jgi:hypothetical protein
VEGTADELQEVKGVKRSRSQEVKRSRGEEADVMSPQFSILSFEF